MPIRSYMIVAVEDQPEGVGLRVEVARELDLREGEPVWVLSALDRRQKVRLPCWYELGPRDVGPDGCVIDPSLARRIGEDPEHGNVFIESGRIPGPDFHVLSWTIAREDKVRPPEDLVILLDVSSSMEGAPIRAAKRALFTLLDAKREAGRSDRLGLVTFGGVDDSGIRVACDPTQDDESYSSFSAAVEGCRAYGWTPMAAGVQRACDLFESLARAPGARDERRIILVTDGYPTDGADELLAALERAGVAEIAIATVGVGSYFDRQLLGAIAARSQAPFVEVHRMRDLILMLEELA